MWGFGGGDLWYWCGWFWNLVEVVVDLGVELFGVEVVGDD